MKTCLTLPKITLEQWAVFRAVVEEGSFALASERLNKSQSGVSYTIAKMEERLPSPALVLQGRKAELTELGKYLYRQAVSLLDQAHAIDRSAAQLAEGWEDEISIACDALVPMSHMFGALQRFSEQCPMTRVRILETTLSGTEEAILERRAQVALTPIVPTGFLGQPLWSVRMLPVASPSHPLLTLNRPVTEQDLKQHRQIVVRDSGRRREQSAGWLSSEQRWTVSHFASSVEAVKSGLGFAFLPDSYIEDALDQQRLKLIPLAVPAQRQLTINLILAEQSYAGPAAKALAEVLQGY